VRASTSVASMMVFSTRGCLGVVVVAVAGVSSMTMISSSCCVDEEVAEVVVVDWVTPMKITSASSSFSIAACEEAAVAAMAALIKEAASDFSCFFILSKNTKFMVVEVEVEVEVTEGEEDEDEDEEATSW